MSRNFELLKQLELEVDVTEERGRVADESARTVDERIVEKELSPKVASVADGEEMLSLAQTIFLSATGRTARQIVFCGVDEDNGSSSVCASAGRALAAIGAKSVCLVDANVRSPRLSRALGVNAPILIPGRSASVREQCVFIDSSLWLAGTELLVDNRGALLPIVDLKRRLKELQDAFEYVLIDAPAAGVSVDAAVLGQIADAAVLVVEANSTRRVTARRAKDTLEAAGVRLLGSVLRNRSFPLPKSLYKRV